MPRVLVWLPGLHVNRGACECPQVWQGRIQQGRSGRCREERWSKDREEGRLLTEHGQDAEGVGKACGIELAPAVLNLLELTQLNIPPLKSKLAGLHTACCPGWMGLCRCSRVQEWRGSLRTPSQ